MPQFSAEYINGQIRTNDQELFSKTLSNFKGPFTIILETFKKGRSNQQNRYLWGVVYEKLSEHLGHTKDEIHAIMGGMFLRQWTLIEEKNGSREIEFVRSTTSLTTVEMEKYLRDIREWASIELGFWIPEPNEEVIHASATGNEIQRASV